MIVLSVVVFSQKVEGNNATTGMHTHDFSLLIMKNTHENGKGRTA